MVKQRYIDFAPVKKKTAVPVRRGAPKRVVAKKPVVLKTSAPEEVPVEEIFEEKPRPAGVSRGLKEPAYGVIEDYQPKFVRAEVKKRPLGAGKNVSAASGRVTAKSAVRAASGATRGVSGGAFATKSAASGAKKASLAPANVRFLNTNKIEKRPLSGTKQIVKKAAVPEKVVTEEKKKSKGPERIIAKPDKDSKAGLIIAVILTIILGAAAGTVAFLLLPK